MKKSTWHKTVLAILITIIHLIPIYIALTVSFKKITDFSSYWTLPKQLFLENYKIAWQNGGMAIGFKNTIIITAIASVLIILISAMAAYPLARNNSKFNNIILTMILSVMMIPPLSLLVPLYVLMRNIGAISTYWGIISVHLAFQLPLAIFLYTNFIRALPRELDEAALIDGCSIFTIFYRIILPLLKPVTVTVLIMTGLHIWNDYQLSLFFLQKPEMKVITLTIATFFGISGANPNVAAAAAIMAVLPVIVVYLFLQKYFIQGMVESAIK
ncbi:MAG: raffinose/stachyose/melibiose transport system permease protein [Thermoanaerobacter sp.]|nr:raffinose/stachyose/melibiose transport system permease protein [Thermoanaerobacter sp.]